MIKSLKCKSVSLFGKDFGKALQLTFTAGVLVHSLEDEGVVAWRAVLAQLHRSVVLQGRADVEIAVAHRHQGADVDPSDSFVEEESPHVTVGTDLLQSVFVLHQLVNRAKREKSQW